MYLFYHVLFLSSNSSLGIKNNSPLILMCIKSNYNKEHFFINFVGGNIYLNYNRREGNLMIKFFRENKSSLGINYA